MATKNKAPDSAPAGEATVGNTSQELIEIGELRTKYKTRAAVFAGVCSAQNWRPGRKVTDEEYTAAVAEFTGSPMDGRPRVKSEKSEVKG